MADGTIIDSLVVSLEWDIKKFVSQQGQILEAFKKFEAQGTKANKEVAFASNNSLMAFRKLKNEVIGLAASFLSVKAFASFTDGLTKADAAMARTAKNTGTTTEDLSLVGGMLQRIGGDSIEASNSYKRLVASIQQTNMTGGWDTSLVFFQNLGVAIRDSHNQALPLLNIIQNIAKAIKSRGMTPQAAQYWGAQAGMTESEMNLAIKMSTMTAAEQQRFIEEQKKLNILSTVQGEKAKQRQDAMERLSEELQKVGRAFVDDLTPGLVKLLDKLTKWVDKFDVTTGGTASTGGPVVDMTEKYKSTLTALDKLRVDVAKVESGSYGYQAVNWAGTGKREIGLTSNTIDQVIARQRANEFGAAGKYQMLKGTLIDAVKAGIVSGSDKFDEENQDKIFNKFLAYRKRPEVKAYIEGTSSDLSGAKKGFENEFKTVAQGKVPMDDVVAYLNNARELYAMSHTNISSSTSSQMHVENVNIHTQATDSKEIAGGFVGYMNEKYGIIAQANTAY